MLDRKTPPAFVQDFSFELIQPEKVVLTNGVPVYFIHGGDQNVIKIELVFNAGAWYEPVPGISYFTASLINKGTHTKTSFEIASSFDQLGAQLEIQPGDDFVSVTVFTLTKKLHSVLSLLSDIIHDSVFDSRELSQAQAIYLQNLEINFEKTSFLASREFRNTIYGTHHPYGRNIEAQDVEQLNPASLKDFYYKNFQHVTVFAAGKISGESQAIICDVFSSITRPSVPSVDHTIQHTAPSAIHVDKIGSIQSSIRIGKRSIPRSSQDYPALVLLNHLLGGYFGSRLMKNIREDKGLTYGIHSSLVTRRFDNYMVIGTDVNKENRDIALDEIRKEFELMQEREIDFNELENGKCHLLGSFQTDLSTTFAHEEKIKTIVLHQLPEDYYTRLTQAVGQINKKDLIQVARKYFDPESFYWISVG